MDKQHEKRFKQRVRVTRPGGCWLWTGSVDGGYGRFRVDGRKRQAHRVAWELAHGPLAETDVVRACPADSTCVNPKHLALGNYDQGESRHKLRAEDAVRIRHRRAQGASLKELADSFGVSATAVGKVVKGESWRSAGGPLERGRDLLEDMRAVADRHGMRLQDMAKWVKDGGLDS